MNRFTSFKGKLHPDKVSKTLSLSLSLSRITVFKTLAQFVIFGCPWTLGLFINNSKMIEILFLILNSQQGTFIFLVYCVLNNEVRKQYVKWMRDVFLRIGPNTL